MSLRQIRTLHTLGPSGTNCEAAAFEWARRNELGVEVKLYPTLESAVDSAVRSNSDALLACIVYPELHSLVFSNLDRMRLLDCFVMPTYHMVLASKNTKSPRVVATHPAPQKLVELSGVNSASLVYVTSNVAAAEACADGRVEACITTHVAAERLGLEVLRDFGPVSMGFSVHVAQH